MRYIFGGKNYYSHFFPYLPRGEKWLNSHFSGGGGGGGIYYIAIFLPIQVRGKPFFQGEMAL